MFGRLFGRQSKTPKNQVSPEPNRPHNAEKPNPSSSSEAAALPKDPRTFALDRVRLENAAGYLVGSTDLPDRFPHHYFSTRGLANGSIAIFPGTQTAETLIFNLPIAKSELDEAQEAGAHVQEGTAFVDLRQVEKIPAELDLYLPLFAKREIRPLMIDMIPETSFGASLANILSRPSWDALRFEAAARTGGCCQVCGDKPQSIECHELWEYHKPKRTTANERPRGVQTLVALLALCRHCHRMCHPGRAEAHGFSDEVWERIAWVNRWTSDQTAAYSRVVQKIWQQRSSINWDLDLRLVRNWELIVQKSKVALLDDGRLQDLKSDRVTGLLGVNWRFSKESEFKKALPLPDWLTA